MLDPIEALLSPRSSAVLGPSPDIRAAAARPRRGALDLTPVLCCARRAAVDRVMVLQKR